MLVIFKYFLLATLTGKTRFYSVAVSAYLKFINLPVWVWSRVTSQRGEYRWSSQSAYVVTAVDRASSSRSSDASSILIFYYS